MKILVTGGCGFIGSHFIKLVLQNHKNYEIINLDKQTYAGKGNNIEHMGVLNENEKRYKFYRGDICDERLVENIFLNEKPDFVVNFAAESHVDKSIEDSSLFVKTNILGVKVLLDASKKHGIKRFVQISTDEVYGSLREYDSPSREIDNVKPRSPYSSSKASADMLALSYFSTFGFPVCITRSSNNYGEYQFPEKIIPLFFTNLILNNKVPMYGDGKNIRDWIYVEDNCRAIFLVMEKGLSGEIYNVGGGSQIQNIELTRKILNNFNLKEDFIEFVDDRKGHDKRYDLNCDKIKYELGWQPLTKSFDEKLNEVISWYKENSSWWKDIKNEKVKTKGIILAGGKGTRLYPTTHHVCKQLLPVYDKPLIYYPLSVLMMAGIKEILIISTPEDIPRFQKLLGDGSHIGINISYKEQENPNGIAEAFLIGEEFIGKDNVCLILGDNIFYGNELPEMIQNLVKKPKGGATIFSYHVKDPRKYGVVDFDENWNILSLEEKPEYPKSNFAVVGLYFYDNDVVNISKELRHSERGELEITDLNRVYLNKKKLYLEVMGRGIAWFDTGTHDSMADAVAFIRSIQQIQGFKVGCIEEIAYRNKFIDSEQLKKIAEPLKTSGYGEYLTGLLNEKVGYGR